MIFRILRVRGTASFPDISLAKLISVQRKAGRRKQARNCFASLLLPFHGPSCLVTSHSLFMLTFVSTQVQENKAPEELAG